MDFALLALTYILSIFYINPPVPFWFTILVWGARLGGGQSPAISACRSRGAGLPRSPLDPFGLLKTTTITINCNSWRAKVSYLCGTDTATISFVLRFMRVLLPCIAFKLTNLSQKYRGLTVPGCCRLQTLFTFVLTWLSMAGLLLYSNWLHLVFCFQTEVFMLGRDDVSDLHIRILFIVFDKGSNGKIWKVHRQYREKLSKETGGRPEGE